MARVMVELLRDNDPANTRIHILLRRETSEADLAQALVQNAFVTEIELSLVGEQRAEWGSLLRVIATRANLEKVTVKDSFNPAERTAPVGLVRAFLRAIQQNTAIQSVDMCWLCLPTDISAFVDNASSIASFSFWDCDMEPAEREQGARDLATALQRNRNITSLWLSELKDAYNTAILEGLKSNISVNTLIFTPVTSRNGVVSDATSHALHQLLESTTSIQKFELRNATFSERQFPSIARAVTGSKCISGLRFFWCRFKDQSSIAQLQSILQNKRNLTSLCLHGCSFGREQVHGDFISLLSRPDSPLRCFEFQSWGDLEVAFPGVQFKNMLQAIQNSKLERLKIGSVETPHQLQTLTESIPSMHTRELELQFWYDEADDDEEGEFSRRETIRQDLLHAVKNNFSLQAVKAEFLTENGKSDLYESTEDKHSLAFYANRNELLDQWVDHPETVEQRKVWPEALSLAQEAGPNALFHGLRSVLERDYVSLPSGRKRKRPQIFDPS